MKITTCPTCEAVALRAVTETVEFLIRGKALRVLNVPHLKCVACGERLFDQESNRVIYQEIARARAAYWKMIEARITGPTISGDEMWARLGVPKPKRRRVRRTVK